MSGSPTVLAPYAGHTDAAGRYLLAPLQGLSFDEMVMNGMHAPPSGIFSATAGLTVLHPRRRRSATPRRSGVLPFNPPPCTVRVIRIPRVHARRHNMRSVSHPWSETATRHGRPHRLPDCEHHLFDDHVHYGLLRGRQGQLGEESASCNFFLVLVLSVEGMS